MKVKGIERNVHTYTALMNVCIKCSKHSLALDTYKLMRQASPPGRARVYELSSRHLGSPAHLLIYCMFACAWPVPGGVGGVAARRLMQHGASALPLPCRLKQLPFCLSCMLRCAFLRLLAVACFPALHEQPCHPVLGGSRNPGPSLRR